ncbi:MAG: ABC transporter permease [Chloroflexota bacterium]
MSRYLLRRLLQIPPVVLGLLALNFALIHLAPGDPLYFLVGEGGDEGYYAAMRARLGLDRSIPERLIGYLAGAVTGDLGRSFRYNEPVLSLILSRVPATLLLTGTALVVSTLVGIWAATAVAARPAGLPNRAADVLSGLLAAVPGFWLGQLLLIIFAGGLGLFPVQGMVSPRLTGGGWTLFVDVAHHLVLPAGTLALLQLALTFRLTRQSVRETLAEDFIRTAWAKGLPPRTILYRHALRHSLLPVVTVVGGHVGTLLAGAAVVEVVFAWPGLGRLLYEAVLTRDYPVVMGIFLVVSVMTVFANLLTDLAYAHLDPRVRYA